MESLQTLDKNWSFPFTKKFLMENFMFYVVEKLSIESYIEKQPPELFYKKSYS